MDGRGSDAGWGWTETARARLRLLAPGGGLWIGTGPARALGGDLGGLAGPLWAAGGAVSVLVLLAGIAEECRHARRRRPGEIDEDSDAEDDGEGAG